MDKKAKITNQTSKEELDQKINEVLNEEKEKNKKIEEIEKIVEGKEEKEEVGEEVNEEEELSKLRNQFKASSREALVLNQRYEEIKKAWKEAENVSVSDEELGQRYGEEKVLEATDDELKLMRENLLKEKRLKKIEEYFKKEEEVANFINQAKEYLKNEETLKKYPELEGAEEEFLRFIALPTRIGLDLESLTKIFLFDRPKTPNKGSLFMTKQINRSEPPKEKKLTVEQAETLRKFNPKMYKEAIKKGLIDFDI